MKNIGVFIVICVVLVAVIGGIYASSHRSDRPMPESGQATTSPAEIGGGSAAAPGTAPKTGGASIGATQVTAEYVLKGKWSAASAPDATAPIAFVAGISADQKAKFTATWEMLKGRLQQDPQDFTAWIDLGTIHKAGGDYRFAADVWEYMTKVFPNNPTAFYNLGDLYQNFLHDYPKAETNYLTAMKLLPTDTNTYRSLAVMYENQYKTGTSAAEDILKKGIAVNPKAIDLYVVLADYYRRHDRISDAKAAYASAITIAQQQKNAELVASLKADLAQMQ